MFFKDEEKAAGYLKEIRPYATPLPRIVKFWDEILGSNLIYRIFILRNAVFDVLRKRFEKELRS